MEDSQIIKTIIDKMNDEELWFTQKTDPTWEEPSSYYKLDEYGNLTEASQKIIIKEVNSLIGDGAVDTCDAIDLWLQNACMEYKVAYKDILVTKFKDKPVVDGIEAYNSQVLNEDKSIDENKKIIENEYDDYVKQEHELAIEYKDRLMKLVTDETTNNFDIMKDILESDDKKIEVDGYYYPEKAVNILTKTGTEYHMNRYMDLTISDTLNMIMDNDSVEAVLDELFDEYKAESALGWGDNFITILNKLDTDVNELDESRKTLGIKTENVKRRLKEENDKSANLISQMFQDKSFDSDSKQGQIVIRTSELFNALSDKGYDVQVSFDNGESTNSILLGQQGGQVVVTITDTNQPLRAFTSGNFEINDDNLKILTDIQNQISSL